MARRSSRTILPDIMIPVDDEIDKVWGEQVVMTPMLTQKTGYRESTVDPSRMPVMAVGVYDQNRGQVEGTGPGFMHKQATEAVSLSIRQEHTDRCQLRKGDRVFFPERDETYEVSYVSADPGGRPDVTLLRIIE